jgi:hypothetical protein
LNFEAQVGRELRPIHSFVLHKEKEMADFRRWIFALALLSLAAGAASAQNVPLSCTQTVTVTPFVRSEGFTELVGDIVITCTSPAVNSVAGADNISGTTASNPNLVGSVTVFLNAPVTSRILGTSAAFVNYSEATLLVNDEISPATFAPAPCTITNEEGTGGAAAQCIGTATATGTYATVSGDNMYPGVINTGNTSITFAGIPVVPPGTGNPSGYNQIEYRITNVRISANSLAAGTITGATPVTATVVFSSNAQGVLVNSASTVAYAAKSLTTGFSTIANAPASLLACTARSFGSTFAAGNANFIDLTYTDIFPTAFKVRVTGANGVPGNTAGTESGYVPAPIAFQSTAPGPNPSISPSAYNVFGGSFSPGLADYGTRVKAIFTGIPSNATIWVPVNNTTSSLTLTTATAPSLVATLTASETGAYSAVAGTQQVYPITAGEDFWVPLPAVGGSATAVWEVTNATTGAVGTLDFPIAIVFNSSTSTISPVSPGTISVDMEYAPSPASLAFTPTSGAAPSASLTEPRFAETGTATTLANITPCTTVLLFPFVSNNAGFETGVGIVGTSQDPFGTTVQSGTCTINFYGTSAGAASNTVTFTTPTISPTAPFAATLTSMGPTAFTGYAIAVCQAEYIHGYASLFNGFGTNAGVFSSYLALVLPNPNTTLFGRPLTCITPGAACAVETAAQ